MSKGNVCPLVWGSHPQERMKYIGSLNEDGVGGGDEPPSHWDVCNDTALFVKPNFSRSDGEVEILVPRLSWHLPPLPDKTAPPAAEGEEGEEGGGEPAGGEAKGEGEEGGEEGGGDKEPAKAKTVFLKPPVDFKYQCPVQDFVNAFSRYIFFHNPRGYAHQASCELPSAITPEAGEATEEGGDEGPSPEAAALAAARALAPVGLFIDNDTGDVQDTLLCFSSSIFGAPLLVTRQVQPRIDPKPYSIFGTSLLVTRKVGTNVPEGAGVHPSVEFLLGFGNSVCFVACATIRKNSRP